MRSDKEIDAEIFVVSAMLAKQRMDLARDFRRLAHQYLKLARESLEQAEAAARRLGPHVTMVDDFDRSITPDVLRELHERDERGAA